MKGRKKKIIVIMGLLLVGVIGVGGYQFMMGGEKVEAILQEFEPDPVFLDFDPFLAPVLEGRRVDRYVSLGVTLELMAEDHKALVHDKMAPLRNAFIQDLNFQSSMPQKDLRGINLIRIKARFKTLATRVLGPEVVNEVLIAYAADRGF